MKKSMPISLIRLSRTFLFFFIVAAFWFCESNNKPAEEELVETTTPYINISSTIPQDISRTASAEDIAKFAWEELLSMSWKSSYTTANPQRGQADNSWSYQTPGAFPDLLVWETYAHRTELRPFYGKIQPFNSPPHYSFGDTSDIKPAPGENPSFDLFNNLDENNEIGSCDIYAHGNRDQMVLYQAKVNQDEYDYFMQNLQDTTVLKNAISNNLSNLLNYKAYYKGATSSCNCPAADSVICLPCGGAPIPNGSGTYQGAIEIKTAWRMLDPTVDDTTRFYRKKVLYYTQGPGKTIYYHNAEFGLVGIHIIHKTQNFPDFIFASWEQVDDRAADMNYVILDPNTGEETGGMKPVLPSQHIVPAYLDSVTNKVWAQLKGINKESIWQYYRLIGVQSVPYNSLAEDPTKNYYMANFVVESDSFLSVFSGPGFGGDPFKNGTNLIYDQQEFNMGGCKGCHGVAQTAFGTDFSFLLDFGNGKPTSVPNVLKSASPANAIMLEAQKKYLVGTNIELK